MHNLFSYFHKQEIDLTAPDGERNIAIIFGRNGYGKTSLLTCLKLLFAGVTESLRRTVQRQRAPTENQYILGVGDDWWGIMNRRARQQGETNCGIRLC
ncbi:ATP-binding protein [Desulfococcaceae bacterium HSG9]|nr:ATP-binding protein [Desulfococcaceae bacterium HSG9]